MNPMQPIIEEDKQSKFKNADNMFLRRLLFLKQKITTSQEEALNRERE
jgi:hypothetical protein